MTLWTSIVGADNQTVATFNTNLQEIKELLLLGYDYEEQMEHLRNMIKPPLLSPSEFYLRLNAAVEIAKLLPNAPVANAGFSKIEMKRAFVTEMPPSWQKALDAANCTLAQDYWLHAYLL